MSLRILIIPDKFKGTLTALEAAAAIAKGWRRHRPDDELDLLPMSDGGDGFGPVLGRLLGAKIEKIRTVDAAHRPCTAKWWWESKSKTAIIESALVVGLAMLKPGEYHPFELDTLGLGAVIEAAAAKGARRCLLGIGGSATNDGGFGMARALGWTFLDEKGKLIESWTKLSNLEQVRPPRRLARFKELVVAVDVKNLLLGVRGASRVYGPQKGLCEQDFAQAEACLGRLARAMRRTGETDYARLPGAGAAGGLGFGLLAFLGARFEPGFDLFANHANLLRRLDGVDLVITGEGAIDRSTLMGKGVGQVARLCRALTIPCLGLAGVASNDARRRRSFTLVHTLTDLTDARSAKKNAAAWLEKLAARAANEAGRIVA